MYERDLGTLVPLSSICRTKRLSLQTDFSDRKWLACRGLRNPEMSRDRRRNVGKRIAAINRTWTDSRTKRQDRNRLARMIGARPSRIAAVVGGDERKVAGPERALEFGKPLIEGLQGCRIAS